MAIHIAKVNKTIYELATYPLPTLPFIKLIKAVKGYQEETGRLIPQLLDTDLHYVKYYFTVSYFKSIEDQVLKAPFSGSSNTTNQS